MWLLFLVWAGWRPARPRWWFVAVRQPSWAISIDCCTRVVLIVVRQTPAVQKMLPTGCRRLSIRSNGRVIPGHGTIRAKRRLRRARARACRASRRLGRRPPVARILTAAGPGARTLEVLERWRAAHLVGRNHHIAGRGSLAGGAHPGRDMSRRHRSGSIPIGSRARMRRCRYPLISMSRTAPMGACC